MAQLYKRGEIWWGRIPHEGKELRASLKTRSEADARKALAEWEARVKQVARGGKPRLTLNEVLDEFIREHVATLRPTTQRRYGISCQWLDEALGDMLLLDISTMHLKEFETRRRSQGALPPTVRRDLSTLSSVFGYAMENEWIDVNPVTPFLKQRRKRGLKESPPRTRYLTREEEARLFAHAMPYVRDAMIFAAYSGLRSEEQFALTWDRVNLDKGEVTIPAHLAKGKRDRIAILLNEAVEVLRRTPRHMRSPFVFHHGLAVKAPPKKPGPVAKLVRPTRAAKDGDRFRHLLRGLKEAARRAEMNDLRWHDLRRTHGCRLLQEQGWSLEMVRDQLGHQSVVQTERAYAFLEVETRREAADKTRVRPIVQSEKEPVSAQKAHK